MKFEAKTTSKTKFKITLDEDTAKALAGILGWVNPVRCDSDGINQLGEKMYAFFGEDVFEEPYSVRIKKDGTGGSELVVKRV